MKLIMLLLLYTAESKAAIMPLQGMSASGLLPSVGCQGSSINFDSNTLYVDCSNNRVGISSTAPLGLLSVGDSTFTVTADGWIIASGTMSVSQLSGCGTGAVFSAGSGNNGGKITTQITGVMSCVFTFKTAEPNSRAPACGVTNETTANLIRATSTSTQVTFAGTTVAGDVIAYSCHGI